MWLDPKIGGKLDGMWSPPTRVQHESLRPLDNNNMLTSPYHERYLVWACRWTVTHRQTINDGKRSLISTPWWWLIKAERHRQHTGYNRCVRTCMRAWVRACMRACCLWVLSFQGAGVTSPIVNCLDSRQLQGLDDPTERAKQPPEESYSLDFS